MALKQHGFDHCLKLVVVALRDGIVLVVVAASALDGQPQQAGGHNLGGVMQDVIKIFCDHAHRLVRLVACRAKKASGDQVLADLVVVVPARLFPVDSLVTCELLADEEIVRKVAIHRRDNIIPISPLSLRDDYLCRQVVKSDGVGIASKVQPVTAPADTVLGRGEQAIDEVVVSSRMGVLEEGLLLVRSGGDPQQVQVKAPQQGASSGRGRLFQAGGLPRAPDKQVDRSTLLQFQVPVRKGRL